MEYKLADLLCIIMGEFKEICGLNEWLFSRKGELMFTTEKYPDQMRMFLEISGGLDYAMALDETVQRPFVLSDEMGLVWIGEFVGVVSDMPEKQIVLMGPMFNSETSLKKISERVNRLNISVSLKLSCMEAMQKIPIIDVVSMRQYGRMLHMTITGERISDSEFIYQNNKLEGQNLPEVHFTDYELALSRENTILQCVKEGNLNYKELIESETKYAKPLTFGLADPVREAKDNVIRTAVLCCRAAIEGGLTIAAAKNIERTAIHEIEVCENISDLARINMEMIQSYVESVHNINLNPEISKQIQDCCLYIQAHIIDDLDLKVIAKNIGYTEYYLSRKFRSEMGIKIMDYIKDKRIEYAKIWLLSSGISIQEISERLRFGTRHYFTKVFKEMVGVTPAEYRAKALVGGK